MLWSREDLGFEVVLNLIWRRVAIPSVLFLRFDFVLVLGLVWHRVAIPSVHK